MEDEAKIQNAIKCRDNWRTVPAIYVNGELIGGCDEMLGLHRRGGLIEKLREAGYNESNF